MRFLSGDNLDYFGCNHELSKVWLTNLVVEDAPTPKCPSTVAQNSSIERNWSMNGWKSGDANMITTLLSTRKEVNLPLKSIIYLAAKNPKIQPLNYPLFTSQKHPITQQILNQKIVLKGWMAAKNKKGVGKQALSLQYFKFWCSSRFVKLGFPTGLVRLLWPLLDETNQEGKSPIFQSILCFAGKYFSSTMLLQKSQNSCECLWGRKKKFERFAKKAIIAQS